MKARAALAALLLLGAGCADRADRNPQAGTVPHWKITLSPRPAEPREMDPTQFQVTITDSAGRPVDGAQVTVQFTMPSMDMGRNEVPAEAEAAGRYEATGRFTMPGDWQVTVQAGKGTAHQAQSFPITVN